MHVIDTDKRCSKCHLTLATITALGSRVETPIACNDAPVDRLVRGMLAIIRETPPGRHAPTHDIIPKCRLCEAKLSLLKTELQACPMNPANRDDLVAMLTKYGIRFTNRTTPPTPSASEPVCSSCGGAHWPEEHAFSGGR